MACGKNAACLDEVEKNTKKIMKKMKRTDIICIVSAAPSVCSNAKSRIDNNERIQKKEKNCLSTI